MNKYDFINELLENKKVTPKQKERILKLVSRELDVGIDLNDRVGKIENIVLKKTAEKTGIIERRVKKKDVITVKSENKHDSKVTYISPSNLYKALLEYNQDPILKTTCHSISSENIETILRLTNKKSYYFDSHLQLIKMRFKKLSKTQKFTVNMFSLINNYINGKGAWSSQNINVSWNSNSLKNWSENNEYMVPNPDETLIESKENEGFFLATPFVSKLTEKPINTFNDLVLYFKSLWHIKFDNPLQSILEKINQEKDYANWADISFSNFSQTLNLYTDVDKLAQTYWRLNDLIKENKKSGRATICVSFYEEGERKILSIHQKDTFWKKSISDTLEKPFGNSMFPIIKNQINGLCDLLLRARFENNECAEINLWDGRKIKNEPIEAINGVQYLLILKK